MMRCFLLLLLPFVVFSCKKQPAPERTNFLELTVDGKKITFNASDTAVLDTAVNTSYWQFDISSTGSPNSYLRWVLLSGSKWVNGNYSYPGSFYPGRSIFYLDLTTYVNGLFVSYALTNGHLNPFTITINKSENGRMHGIFSGTITCASCGSSGTTVQITGGEFEMPYRIR